MAHDEATPLLVQTGPGGRRLIVGQLSWSPRVVDDPETGRRVPLDGDFTPFCITIEGTEHLVIAGTGSDIDDRVEVRFFDGVETYPVRNRVWMTFPTPFTSSTRVTVVWYDDAGAERKRVKSPLLTPDTLEPVFGPGWKFYA
jgi:hypothetical protein